MFLVGSDASVHRDFAAQLSTTHRMRVKVRLLDLEGAEVADLSDQLVDGQVDIDSTAETSRSASVTLDDPDHSLHLDSDAPAEGGLYVDRMVSIVYGVYVAERSRWVDVPIFTGPVTGMARDGDSIAVTCLGKEHLAKGMAWRPMTLRKGMDTVAAIKTILRERAGEEDFDFPAKAGRLDEALSLGRLTQPWAVAQQLARSINRHLYYDGGGTCRLRRIPEGNVWTFRDGDGGTVLTAPAVSYDLSSVSNLVQVLGKKPKGKPRIVGVAVAPRSHALSPHRQGRNIVKNGKTVRVPRYLVAQVSNDKIRSRKDATTVARRELGTLLRQGVDVSFNALPVPFLDPLDPVRLDTDVASVSFTLHKASLPLTHGGVMSVGTNMRVTPNMKVRSRR